MYLVIDDGWYIFLDVDPRQNGYTGPVVADVDLGSHPRQSDTLNWLLDRTPRFPYLGRWSENQFCACATYEQVEQQGYEMIGLEWRAYREWPDWLEDKPGVLADEQQALAEVSAAVERLERATRSEERLHEQEGLIARGWRWLRSHLGR